MGEAEKENELTKQIKKSADEDKNKYCINMLEEGISLREKWQGIKRHKKQVTPNCNKAKDIRGNMIAKGDRAEATTEYLENKDSGRKEMDYRIVKPIRVKWLIMKQDLTLEA